MTRVLLLAGEPSGDRIAAGVARTLRRLEPGVEIRAMGSALLREAGAHVVVDSTELAVVGLTEVAGSLPAILRARRDLLADIDAHRPDVVVPVDYPDFNVVMASAARRRGVPVAWLVGPQVWAWRPGRVRRYARAVSRILVLFPFETAIWEAAGVPVEHVGHPLLDLEDEPLSRAAARERLGLPRDARVLALLPGSRRREVRQVWPAMAEAARLLAHDVPGLHVVVPLAPGLEARALAPPLAAEVPLCVVAKRGAARVALAACDAAAVASGTATLEAALVPRALVACYRVGRLTMALSRVLAEREFLARGLFALPNLVMGRRVVPELYQERFTPRALAEELAPLLADPARRDAAELALAPLRELLGGRGALERIARAVLEVARSSQKRS